MILIQMTRESSSLIFFFKNILSFLVKTIILNLIEAVGCYFGHKRAHSLFQKHNQVLG